MRYEFEAFLEQQRGRFVLFLPAFMGAGMLVYFGLAEEPSCALAAAAFAICAVLTRVGWLWRPARAGALAASFLTGGFALACLATARTPPWDDLPRHAVVVEGQISQLEILPDSRRVTIVAPRLDGAAPLARALRIHLRHADAVTLAPGDVVRVRALVRPPPPPEYPGGWDTQREAYFSGLAGYGFAIGGAERLADGSGAWARFRDAVARRLMAGLPGVRGAIAATLLTAQAAAIPQADRAAFQDSGLAHLLAVAGLHIGIVMGLAFGATRFGLALWERAALYWPTRQIAVLAGLAAGGFYLALTGAHVPILRSFAMAALVALGVLTGRRAVSLRGLALAATLLLMMAPSSVIGVSFQMSFSAVLTLIAGYELLQPYLGRFGADRWWRGPGLHVAGLALTSLLAGTASLPFAAYHFGRATLYYVPANMLAVPLTAFWVMPWGLAALALMPFGLETVALAPMGWGIGAVLYVARSVAGWPDAVTLVPALPGWGLALVAVALLWGGLWRGRLRWGALAPLALALASPVLGRPPDVLITPQAAVIAWRLPGRTLVWARHGASRFALEAPARLWGDVAGQRMDCAVAACANTVRGVTVVVTDRGYAAVCPAVLVSPAWLAGGCGTVIDRAVIGDGAAALWLGADGATVWTDRMARGLRPWVITRVPRLPMALTE